MGPVELPVPLVTLVPGVPESAGGQQPGGSGRTAGVEPDPEGGGRQQGDGGGGGPLPVRLPFRAVELFPSVALGPEGPPRSGGGQHGPGGSDHVPLRLPFVPVAFTAEVASARGGGQQSRPVVFVAFEEELFPLVSDVAVRADGEGHAPAGPSPPDGPRCAAGTRANADPAVTSETSTTTWAFDNAIPLTSFSSDISCVLDLPRGTRLKPVVGERTGISPESVQGRTINPPPSRRRGTEPVARL